MRGSAPKATEYRTNFNALPLIGSIRLFDVLSLIAYQFTCDKGEEKRRRCYCRSHADIPFGFAEAKMRPLSMP